MEASTPVAVRPVVILGDRLPKQEMDEALEHALLAEGIDPARTKVGWNVITRFGDPTDIHALVRVSIACSSCRYTVAAFFLIPQ